jgi:hypothetical protein
LIRTREQILQTSSPRDSERPHWWTVEPLSILELADPLQVAAHGREAFEPARIVARVRELNATAAHVFPLACHLDGDTLFFRQNSPGDPPPAFDYLGEWLEHSIPSGLRTIVYFNVHSVKGAYARKHPQWQARRMDGSPKEDVYNIESTFCVNSPWRRWVFDRVRELCDYAIDGIFYDGPVFFDDCCYCPHCREKFAAKHQARMPAMNALDDLNYPKLVEFRSGSIADFVRESRELIKSIRPSILFYVNANPLQPSRLTARDNRKLAKCQDVLASEGGFLGGDLMTDGPIWKVGMNAKLLETQASAAGVPHLVFDSLTHTPWTYYTLPAAEAKLLWASSVAHGAATWMSSYKNAMHRPAVLAVKELYAFARKHREELFETRSAANVAVVVSSATLNYYEGADLLRTDFTAAQSSDAPGNVTRELYGWYHALWANHIPFDLIDEVPLDEGRLTQYRVLILPNVACLSGASVDGLHAFVEAGGTLIASFQSGFHDENGVRRTSPALDDLLGVRRRHPTELSRRQCDYLLDPASQGESALETCIPSPAYALDVVPTDDAQTLFTFSRPMPDRYAGVPEDSGRAAVIEHRIGRGTAIYFACDMGAALWQWRLPEHRALVTAMVRRGAQPLVELPDAPPCLDLSLRQSRDARKVFVHLVNYNGGMTRPIERVLPLRDIVIRLRVPAYSAAALFTKRGVDFTRDGEWSCVRLPVLEEYEILQFEMVCEKDV